MKHVFVLALLVAAACAPEEHDISPNTVEVAGAKSEAILARCTNTSCVCDLAAFDSMRHTMDLNYGCTSQSWNPHQATGGASTQNTTCKYLGNKTTIRIDQCFGVAGGGFFDSRFRISKTVGSSPTFNPWLIGTCYGQATCITQ